MAGDALTVTNIPGSDVLGAFFLCGIMGVVGQGIRAVVGLKNAGYFASNAPNSQTVFSSAYFFLSLMIGFIAGILAGIALDIKNFVYIDLSNTKLLLGIIVSGYAGADFVENTMSLVIPGSNSVTPGNNTQISSLTTNSGSASLASSFSTITPALANPPASVIGDGAAALTAAMRIVCPGVSASSWVPDLISGFSKYDISNNNRKAAAIGQFLVEAGSRFQELIENLHYSPEQAFKIFPHKFSNVDAAKVYTVDQRTFGNYVYASRNGNGDEQSGDGFLFRGRGLIQLTGRTEYTDFGKTINKSAEEAAVYCETREGAAISGCWYLYSKGCLPLADKWDIDQVTLRVNGSGMVGASQRESYSRDMLKHL